MLMAAIPGNILHSLIINDVGAMIPIASLRRIGEYLGRDPVFKTMKDAELYFRKVYAPFGNLTDDQWRHFTTNSVRNRADQTFGPAYDPAIVVPFQQNLPEQDLNFQPVWQAIRIPAMMIRGSESDLFLAETVEQMKIIKPNSVDLCFEGCGHAPMLWDANQITPIIKWLVALAP